MPRRKQQTPRKRQEQRDRLTDDPDDLWHEIKGILDERQRHGKTQYLVDWEPCATTGRPYRPSWQEEVTKDALDEWEAKKSRLHPQSSPISSSLEARTDSQESQPPRPANWRSLERSAAALEHKRRLPPTAQDRESSKRQRFERTISPPGGPAPSITTASSAVSCTGSPQPSEQVYAINDEDQEIAVVLQKNADFDPSEYHSVAGTNTQSTGFSSQSLSQLENQDAQLLLGESPFNSRQTIPDSQELQASSISQLVTPSVGPQHLSKRVIADSQAESQGFTDSYCTGKVSDKARGLPAPQEKTTEIPSGQLRSQSDRSSINHQLASTDSRKPNDSAVVYRSQPSFSPLIDSLATTSSHRVAETPSQPGELRGISSVESLSGVRRQWIINSQISQAAQVTHEPGSPLASPATPTSPSSQTRARLAEEEVELDPSASTMEDSQGTHTKSPRSSAFEDLTKVFNLGAPEASHEAGTEKPALQAELDGSFTMDADAHPSASVPLDDHGKQEQPSGLLIGDDDSTSIHPELTIQSQPRMSGGLAQETHFATPGTLSELDQSAQGSLILDPSGEAMSATLRADLATETGTVTPSDILRSAGIDPINVLPALGQGHLDAIQDLNSSLQAPPMGQGELDTDNATPGSSDGTESREELITLPFQASARDDYMRLIEASRDAIQQYSTHFAPGDEEKEDPPEALVQQIDKLFRALQNACDYPMDLIGTSLEELGPREKTKYARDANAKFNFLFELLQGITSDTRVLIVARSTELLRLIHCVTEALEVECVCQALGIRDSVFKSSAAVVQLALPSEKISTNEFDVVVGFDNSLSNLSSEPQETTSASKVPVILRLVTTHAIDHIDFKVAHDIVPLERRQAIIWAIVMGRHLISDPERGYREPHEIAKLFYDVLNGDTEYLDWDPVPLPDDLLMVCVGSQGQDVAPIAHEVELDKGLKRRRDEDDSEDAKRLKTDSELDLTAGNQDPPISDSIQDMLDAVSIGEEALAAHPTTVPIHLIMLQLLAEKFSEMQRQHDSAQLDEESKVVIEEQAKQLRSYRRSTKKIYDSHRSAIEDRNLFEKKMQDAEQKKREAETKVEKMTEKFELRIASLEADKARLLGTNEGANGEDTPLALNEKQLKDAQEKVKVLEKRLAYAQQEGEYVREQYQRAQSAAGETSQLRTQLKKAEEDAAKNKVRIHEINVANSNRGYLSRITELETKLRERDAELDRAREELRSSKNGRRETRQSSVPRSPRMGMGMLSPRAPARSYPSSTSRGGSPGPVGMEVGNVAGGTLLPGMQLLPQTPANGRWTQL